MTKYVSSGQTGDIARCVNGHDLYRLLADVMPASVMESDKFETIGEAPKPEYGKPVARCHVCGTPWITKGPGGGWVFCNIQRRFEK